MEIDLKIDPIESTKIREELFEWLINSKCSPPSPNFVKMAVLLRHSLKECTWVETGTHLGNTALLLSDISSHVHTIEPSIEFIQRAKDTLLGINNVTLHEGTSEDCLENIISSLEGNVCFWLDGHYSSGTTFKGISNTPMKHELSIIEKLKSKITKLVVLIDDIRDYFSKNNKLSVADFKDLAKTSRKYAVPLLEYLDKKNITYREDNYRRLA